MRTKRVRPATSLRGAVLAALIALVPVFVWSQAKEPEKVNTVLLTDGTPVHLVLMDDLRGKGLRAGQAVHFTVREDLRVESKLVVKTGTEAIGHIESVSGNGLLGISGKFVLQFDYVTTVSGAKLLLRGGARVNGGKGGALTTVSELWYGPNANLPVGTVINAYVNKDQPITLP